MFCHFVFPQAVMDYFFGWTIRKAEILHKGEHYFDVQQNFWLEQISWVGIP